MSSQSPHHDSRVGAGAVLEIRNLTVTAGGRKAIPVVRDLTFELREGEILGVVGESGSGKTMTALSILGLLPQGVRVADGEIAFNGLDLTKVGMDQMRDIRGREIAMVFQDPGKALNPVHKIGRQIAEPLLIHDLATRREAAALAVEAMHKVGIPAAEDRVSSYPFEFSGGMRQRVLISMALTSSPRVLIADEPTTGLDVTLQVQVLELIRDLAKRLNMSTMLVSHDLNLIARICDRVQVMYAGQIVESGATAEVLGRPRHPYTEALVRAVPRHGTPPGERLYALPGAPMEPSSEHTGCSLFARCGYRRQLCQHEEPALVEVVPDHSSACWVTQLTGELRHEPV